MSVLRCEQEFDRDPDGLVHVDLYLPSAGSTLFSVSNQLVTMGLAKRVEGRKREVQETEGEVVPSHVHLYPGDRVDVIAPTVNSPSDFYIQMVR